MQSIPSEAGRTQSRAEPRADPRTDVRGDPPGDAVLPASESPSVVLRIRWPWRLPGLLLIVLAGLLVVSGRWWGLALVVVAVPFLPALWLRVEMNERMIRRRDWRRHWTRVELASVAWLRLRRLPFAALQWLPRGYHIGRFWSVPLTLRLQYGEEVRFELRCAWWDGWRDVARHVASRPGIDLDARTRGRIGRYVGPIAVAPSDQP